MKTILKSLTLETKMETIAFTWKNQIFSALDQRKLPHQEVWINCKNITDVHAAIKDMVVRGAPLIGITALYGLLISSIQNTQHDLSKLEKDVTFIKTARPTAVNLAYEADRYLAFFKQNLGINDDWDKTLQLAEKFIVDVIQKLDQDNLKMAQFAEKELATLYGDRKYKVVTLCNTGALACGPRGTAFGVIDYLSQKGKVEHVFAAETRPYLQGGRLTAYELKKAGIPYSVFVEGAMFHLFENNKIDAVFIGADRIVSNGDTANKIGSATLSLVAKHFNVPFYVVAPTSSFDISLNIGSEIEIEYRPEEEVTSCQGVKIAPDSSRAYNPSFDVTPHQQISAIFCENAMIKPVERVNVRNAVTGA